MSTAVKAYWLVNKRAWLHTRGSGDPSSGCICNAAGFRHQCNWTARCLTECNILCGQFSIRCMSKEPYLSQTEQWWHRSGFSSWQRSQKRIAEETQPIQSHSRPQRRQPLSLTLDHRLTRWLKWMHDSVRYSPVVLHQQHCVLHCTSRVGSCVDRQILGYPPQDLLLRLSPIFTLQQLLVRVGQVELCRAEHRGKDKQHLWLDLRSVLFTKSIKLSK